MFTYIKLEVGHYLVRYDGKPIGFVQKKGHACWRYGTSHVSSIKGHATSRDRAAQELWQGTH